MAKAANPTSDIRGVSLVDGSGATYAWVKFGATITMAEGRTQNYVAQVVNSSVNAPVRIPSVYLTFEWDDWGFIAMEFVDGITPEYNERDIAAIAAAVQFLVDIKGPDLVPGPIGGGPIRHPFFLDRESAVSYSSVDWLQQHINNILRLAYGTNAGCVDLSTEVETYGLRLCPADLNRDNFKKDRTNRIVALDFGATCFLPVSFFKHVLNDTTDHLTILLRSRIELPESPHFNMLSKASFALVPRLPHKPKPSID
ncbi:unnamed protein product [Cyclocybe aegerita]|uniref:Aminoglycoside phosphotransferase domain-containing protein n=1 Tax=Cyclocybe aegerita TaxID=1973307 RepID=A0A8S0W0U9_CYCAE|nr:unnamed protein product [Cyclocybe aegerita]